MRLNDLMKNCICVWMCRSRAYIDVTQLFSCSIFKIPSAWKYQCFSDCQHSYNIRRLDVNTKITIWTTSAIQIGKHCQPTMSYLMNPNRNSIWIEWMREAEKNTHQNIWIAIIIRSRQLTEKKNMSNETQHAAFACCWSVRIICYAVTDKFNEI